MRAEEIIGLRLPALSRLGPSVSLGAGWVRTSVMRVKCYWASNTDWMPDGLHFHESGDEIRTHLVLCELDHPLNVACRGFLDSFDFVGGAAGGVDRVHVHVRGEPGQQLLALAADDVDHAGGHVTRGEDLRQSQCSERMRLRRERDDDVAPAQ